MAKKKLSSANQQRPGIAFEKVVAALQARFDASMQVEHNIFLTDRLQQRRQFDVVFRGAFAGQPLLGVIECKDLNRAVGTPEVDAFQTKSTDVNANFRVLISRKGFTAPAVEKCKHYGIQTLSLLARDPVNDNFRIGNYWYANLYVFERFGLSIAWQPGSVIPSTFNPETVKLNGRPVLEWYGTYLTSTPRTFLKKGWTARVQLLFNQPQTVEVEGVSCGGCVRLDFSGERGVRELEYFVGISGQGFYDWQTKEIRLPANTEIITDAVPMDMSKWSPKKHRPEVVQNWVNATIEGAYLMEPIPDAIDLCLYGIPIEVPDADETDLKG